MIPRPVHLSRLETALARSPVTALLGPRQCGKTTLARQIAEQHGADYYDLESMQDSQRLRNPERALEQAEDLVVIDEIQRLPHLFEVLRVVVDRSNGGARFLILGSAAPNLVREVSETLAGRVEFVDLTGFDLAEVGQKKGYDLWVRGGFPRSFLAASNDDSFAWREGFVRTFLERDIPELGLSVPPTAMRRFWTMLAHCHGQVWNASRIGRSMGLSDKTVRRYLDLLTGTYMVRQLDPWFENLRKRQVKSPKIYLRDSGVLHHLLALPDYHGLIGHPAVGASWEGFALEQLLQVLRPAPSYFWSTHQGAELDLLVVWRGKRFGFELKFAEAPKTTKSMRIAIEDLALQHLWIVHPGRHAYEVDEHMSVLPVEAVPQLSAELEARSGLGSDRSG
ncbi:MAG: hypothetical protein CME06_09590 [Gemmatimonadetes bacterium]|nr:hypothetical protein [Gemmatimonadota bacterium]